MTNLFFLSVCGTDYKSAPAGANMDKLSLFDQQGRAVRVWHKLPLKTTVELDGLPAGLYHIVAEAGTDRRTGRLSVY